MYWSEDTSAQKKFVIPDDIVDISYRIECKALPLDHAWSLSQALHQALPWLKAEDKAGVHLIHVAESGNGWYRPDDPETGVLYLSKRTRMTLRVPKERIDAALQLTGSKLEIDGHPLVVGEGAVKPLSNMPTLFARYVVCASDLAEDQFIKQSAQQIMAMGVPVTKLLAGKQTSLRLPDQQVTTRSLMIAELTPEHSVLLQQQGLGGGRKYGCGLFLPQKGIVAVKTEGE